MNCFLGDVRIRYGGVAFLALSMAAGCGGGGIGNNNPGGGGGGQTVSVNVVTNSTFVDTFTPQQFSASVTGDPANKGVSWSVDTVAGGNATVGTISATGLYTPPSGPGNHTIKATSVADTTKSATASLAVVPFGVYTFHNNLARDGANTHESFLTTANVNQVTFGKKFSCAVDGATYTQPLWVPSLNIGGIRNVIFVATEHDSAYAFDADTSPCVQLWHVNLIDSAHGGSASETPVPNPDIGTGFGDIQPEIGVTGTPVIDPATQTMYLVTKSESSGPTFHVRLHALDLLTGNEKFSGPVNVSASVSGTGAGASGGNVSFDTRMEHQRSGLTLANGVVYVPWAAHEDADPYHGWLIAFDAGSMSRKAVYNATPNGTRGGIWMGGGAAAVDGAGNLYVLTGNGTFNNANNNYGDSALKLNSNLVLSDWFTPYNQADLETFDTDLASSGLFLVADQPSGPPHLLVASGKEGRVYLINRDSMGHFCSTCGSTDTNIIQSLFVTNNFGTPAFWNNALYFGGADFGSGGDFVKRFIFTPGANPVFATSPASKSATRFPFPGAIPSVSSQGTNNGIVWAIDASQYGPPSSRGSGPAVLHAYDAKNLATELWNSSEAAGDRDQAGNAVKFTTPTIAHGMVYLSTRTEIDVYGLLP
jgi:hypothetical protein